MANLISFVKVESDKSWRKVQTNRETDINMNKEDVLKEIEKLINKNSIKVIEVIIP